MYALRSIKQCCIKVTIDIMYGRATYFHTKNGNHNLTNVLIEWWNW